MILKSWFGTCLQGQLCEICGHYIMRYIIIWFEISEYLFLEEAEFPKEELAQKCIKVRGSGSLPDTSCMFKLSVSRKSFQHRGMLPQLDMQSVCFGCQVLVSRMKRNVPRKEAVTFSCRVLSTAKVGVHKKKYAKSAGACCWPIHNVIWSKLIMLLLRDDLFVPLFLMSSLPWLHQASECIWLALPIWCCLVCRISFYIIYPYEYMALLNVFGLTGLTQENTRVSL